MDEEGGNGRGPELIWKGRNREEGKRRLQLLFAPWSKKLVENMGDASRCLPRSGAHFALAMDAEGQLSPSRYTMTTEEHRDI